MVTQQRNDDDNPHQVDAKDVATEGEGGFGEKVEESQRRRVKEEEEGGLADEKLEESNLGEDSRLPAVSKDGLWTGG